MSTATENLTVNDRVRVCGRYEMGVGEVLRVCETGGVYVADVVFESRARAPAWKRSRSIGWRRPRRRGIGSVPGKFDNPKDFLLRQLAWQFALGNTGGELTNSRTQLLPHQILLTHDMIKMTAATPAHRR